MTIFCTSGSLVDGSFKDKEILYNKFTGFSLKAKNDATLHLSRTCRINGRRDLQVNLKPVRKSELEGKRDGQMYGGEFTLTLDCSNTEINKAYIMFTDQLDINNVTNFLTTQNGGTKRTDVKFVIKDGDNDVYYGPPPTSPIILKDDYSKIIKEFGSKNGPTISKRYTVYYQRTWRTVEPGEVQGKVIYNLYYN